MLGDKYMKLNLLKKIISTDIVELNKLASEQHHPAIETE